MARRLVHHRGPEFKKIFVRVRDGLKWMFGTEQEVLTLTASGTGTFEAGMVNFTSRGDKIVAVGGGKFGRRWADVAEAWEMDVVPVEVEWGKGLRAPELESVLEDHADCAMVVLTASETSTGVFHPVEALAEVVEEASDALFAVDGITAVGVHPLSMDELGIDVLVSGSQKGFGVPPGLGFVAASSSAWERYDGADSPGYYFDLARERGRQVDAQTAFTPAIPQVLALDEALEMMGEEGKQEIYRRHERNARATRAAVQAMGLEVFGQPHSRAVTAVQTPDGLHPDDVVDRMREQHGAVIAGGQKHLSDEVFRLGHIGFFEYRDMMHEIGALEMTLRELGLPVASGDGVGAAQAILAA
jgi:aspartate aminotransferase-like enzyme